MTARQSSRMLMAVIAAPIGGSWWRVLRACAAGVEVLYEPDLLAAPLSRCVRTSASSSCSPRTCAATGGEPLLVRVKPKLLY